MYNALTNKPLHKSITKANVIVNTKEQLKELKNDNRIAVYQIIDSDFKEFFCNNVYLSSLNLDDKIIDSVINHVLGNKANIIIDTARTLDEVGFFDVKKNASPIMYAEKLGLLQNSLIAGGVYLDKDDVDLMVQQNASLILAPSYDAGHANGIPPYKLYKDRGLVMHFGTMDNSYNKTGCINYEKDVLQLLVNGTMREQIL